MSIDFSNISTSGNSMLSTQQNVNYGVTNYYYLSTPHLPLPDEEVYRNLTRARDHKAKDIAAKNKAIQSSYNDLKSICTGVTKSLGREYRCIKTIEQEVDIQKIRFAITSQSLLMAVKNTPFENRDRILLYTHLADNLEDISGVLKDVPYHLRTILGKFQEAEMKQAHEVEDSAEKYHPDEEFKDVLELVRPYLNKFYSLAKSLTKQPATTEAPEEVKRLYVESLAATTLFRCLSQACPVDGHRSHTVYLGLSMDDADNYETLMAIESRATSLNRVWFRVQSVIDTIVPKETKSSAGAQVLNTSTRKRKLPPDAPMSPGPSPKARKTSGGRVLSRKRDNDMTFARGSSRRATNQIQVCPEYLTQGEDSSLMVMRMVGTSQEWHNIYFLGPDQRPPDRHTPINLANLFGGWGGGRGHYFNFSWRVRVARLVAETVLRIQHPRSPCHWGENDVVFYAIDAYGDNPSEQFPKPFLKVDVERQENEITPNTMAAGRPGRWLLNLALILLQLGLSRHIHAPPGRMGEKEYRKRILMHVDNVDDELLEKYLTVVRSCVELNSGSGDNCDEANEHDFHKKYYQLIIFPLKMIENDLEPSGSLAGTIV